MEFEEPVDFVEMPTAIENDDDADDLKISLNELAILNGSNYSIPPMDVDVDPEDELSGILGPLPDFNNGRFSTSERLIRVFEELRSVNSTSSFQTADSFELGSFLSTAASEISTASEIDFDEFGETAQLISTGDTALSIQFSEYDEDHANANVAENELWPQVNVDELEVLSEEAKCYTPNPKYLVDKPEECE
ncbi:hypothetical protein M3Y95_00630000 [Aphelenchoides besseyi]|nr:hypothetical protein M3Y95_00630000 [Aphelenchoides besseyi]